MTMILLLNLPLEAENLDGTKALVLHIPANSRARVEPFIIMFIVVKGRERDHNEKLWNWQKMGTYCLFFGSLHVAL